jgi:hypothetical protein
LQKGSIRRRHILLVLRPFRLCLGGFLCSHQI